MAKSAAEKLAEAKAAVKSRAIKNTKAKRGASGKKETPKAKAPVRTKGILNIIKKRKDQAMRVANKQARGR